MAITWKKKITVLDVKRGNVSVTLTRVDDTDPQQIKTSIFTVLDALINTPKLRRQVLDELKRQYQAQKKKVVDDAVVIGTFDKEVDDDVKVWGV
ncbi:hypothetical protein LCGC14_2907420 [marine sediment metagenome]|uniref:Uncharacterized protein n=1 Tax=marine sediment metagenome TaxID=412755 RepID=A0A0F8YEF2_9ZZZZ